MASYTSVGIQAYTCTPCTHAYAYMQLYSAARPSIVYQKTTCTQTHKYIDTHIQTHINAYIHAYTQTHKYINIYIHTHINAYIHTYIHTYIQ